MRCNPVPDTHARIVTCNATVRNPSRSSVGGGRAGIRSRLSRANHNLHRINPNMNRPLLSKGEDFAQTDVVSATDT